jgi:hypothetical protein
VGNCVYSSVFQIYSLVVQKIALTLFALLVAVMVVVTTAFSFGLGQGLQNALMIVVAAVSLLWLYFTWSGKVTVALIGIVATLVIGVFVIPFLLR